MMGHVALPLYYIEYNATDPVFGTNYLTPSNKSEHLENIIKTLKIKARTVHTTHIEAVSGILSGMDSAITCLICHY